MTTSESEHGLDGPERLDYFMIRLARREGEPQRVAGLIERLATGERRGFDTADQLVRLVMAWEDPRSNLGGELG
jgi:hypothetical protein